jgi:Endonuclease NucS
LAEDLGKLEDGLELIETEYKLPNPIGGKGFIDILARDRFGLLVVIEIKRSDATARQAIHEIFKYTALLRSNHGVAEDAVRCVVLSTDWHELLVPFSELTASAPYHVDGYKIEVDDAGVCTALEPVRPIEDSGSLELCPSGLVYLYTTADEREAHRDERVRAAEEVGITDYLLIEQDYIGDSERVIYPFADCFIVAMVEPSRRLEVIERLDLEPEEFDIEESPVYLEETLSGEIASHSSHPGGMTAESIGPDKFRSTEADWPPKQIRRYGERLSSPLRTDDDLLAMVRSDVGGNSSVFQQVASPGIMPVWRRVREDLGRCLLGNSGWTELVGLYLDELEEKQAPAVAISLFNPVDLVMGLFKAHTEGSTSYLPSLQVVAEPGPAGEAEGIVGFITWDGETVKGDPREMLDRFFEGELFNYFLMRNFNEVWQVEDDLLAWHGLRCSATEITGADEPEMCSLRAEEGQLHRGPRLEETGAHSIADFLAAHEDYLEQLTCRIRAMSIGL